LSLSATAKLNDEMALAIGHIEGDTIFIDLVEAWTAETDGTRTTPDDALAQIIGICKEYRVKEIQGDKYNSGWIERDLEEFEFSICPLSKSDLFLNLLPLVNNSKIRLPDDPVMLSQLKYLERKRGRHG
jgi:hypothetical protein